jgi:hypothetical protein
MANLEKIAEAKCKEPMSTWPDHIDFHRRNTHPFSGSKWGEMYFDETCLRCQLEKAAEKAVTKEKPSGS